MSLPTSEPIPFPEDELPPARRRRQRRLVLPDEEDEGARVLDELSLRLTPGLEFFLSALLSGVVFGLAQLCDSPALVVLAALLAPFMGPALGPGLAAAAGSLRYLLRSLGWLLTAGLIYFLSGTLSGIGALIFPVTTAGQTAAHLRLDWTGLVLLSVGAVLTTYLLGRAPQQKPSVSSVAIAYSLFLPLGAAGYALTGGIGGAWWNGLLVFGAHLVWTALCATLVLMAIGLRPRKTAGYVLSALYLAACLAAALPAILPPAASPVSLAQSPSTSPTAAQVLPSATITASPLAARPPASTPTAAIQPSATPGVQSVPSPTPQPSLTPSPTPTHTLVPTNTPTITVTPQATPVYARINAKGGDGAFIRTEPRYAADVVVALLNGVIVEVLPDVAMAEGVAWAKVRLADGQEGWIVRSYLATATPAPGW
jgi:uncharacterized membrane protein